MSLGISRKLCSPHLPLAAQDETFSSLIAAAGKGEGHMGLSVLQARSDHVLFTQPCSFFDVGHTVGISQIWSVTSVSGSWLGLAVWSGRFSTQTRTCKGPSPQYSSGNFLTLYPIHGINQMSRGALRPVPMEASWYHESGSGSRRPVLLASRIWHQIRLLDWWWHIHLWWFSLTLDKNVFWATICSPRHPLGLNMLWAFMSALSVLSSQCHLQCIGPKGNSRHSYSIPPTLTCSTDTTPFEGSVSCDRVRRKGYMSFSSVKF